MIGSMVRIAIIAGLFACSTCFASPTGKEWQRLANISAAQIRPDCSFHLKLQHEYEGRTFYSNASSVVLQKFDHKPAFFTMRFPISADDTILLLQLPITSELIKSELSLFISFEGRPAAYVFAEFVDASTTGQTKSVRLADLEPQFLFRSTCERR